MKQLSGYLRLARPANIVTAFADILAGVAIAMYAVGQIKWEPLLPGQAWVMPGTWNGSYWQPILLLLLSTLGLYGGGVVMNDVFDADLDAVERPERPIPSELIPKKSAAAWGIGLLTLGIIAAGLVHWPYFFSFSFWLAVAVACAALPMLGPIGFCIAFNKGGYTIAANSSKKGIVVSVVLFPCATPAMVKSTTA